MSMNQTATGAGTLATMPSGQAADAPEPMLREPAIKDEDYEDEPTIPKPRAFVLVKDYTSKVVDGMAELRFPARRIKNPNLSSANIVLDISIGFEGRPNCCLVSMDNVSVLADWINGEEDLGDMVMSLKFRPLDDIDAVAQKAIIPALGKIKGVKRVNAYDSVPSKAGNKLALSMQKPASNFYEWEMWKVDALRLRANLNFAIWLKQKPGGVDHLGAAGQVFDKMLDRVEGLFRQMCKPKPGECKPVPSDKEHAIYVTLMSLCGAEFYRWRVERSDTTKEDLKEAAKVVRYCLEAKLPSSAVAIINRHLCAVELQRGKFKKARKAIDKAIKVEPKAENKDMLKEAKQVARLAGYTWKRSAGRRKPGVVFNWKKHGLDDGELQSGAKRSRA